MRFYELPPADEAEDAAHERWMARYFGGVVGSDEPTDPERLGDLAGTDVAALPNGEAVDRWVAQRFPGRLR
jgi:hypothetical protein